MRTIALAASALAALLVPTLVPATTHAGGLSLVASTGHAVYFARRARDVDVRRSESFLARLDTLFGAPPPGWRVQYYRHESLEGTSARVGFAASGVTDLATGRVDSVHAYHPHELVHAAMGRLGQPPAFVAEGLAVALTSGGRWNGRPLDDIARAFRAARGELRDVTFAFALDDPERDYALAGSFVAHLLDRYGIEPLLTYVRGCRRESGCRTSLAAAYGRPFAALEAEWALALNLPEPERAWYDAATWPGSLLGPAPPARLLADSAAEVSR